MATPSRRTPVTRPVLFTVAIDGLDDVHGLLAEGVPEPMSCLVPPAQVGNIWVIVGNGFTVTVKLATAPQAVV